MTHINCGEQQRIELRNSLYLKYIYINIYAYIYRKCYWAMSISKISCVF